MPNIQIIGVPEEEDTKKGHEKILEEIIVKNFPKMGNTPKTHIKHPKTPKTHINQTNKDQTQKANIKSSNRKAINNT